MVAYFDEGHGHRCYADSRGTVEAEVSDLLAGELFRHVEMRGAYVRLDGPTGNESHLLTAPSAQHRLIAR